jgi:predicted DNA-binding protein YlxM (UPF0122 family)
MAYSETQWLNARGYFEAGLSLSQIQEKTGIARSSISKKSKSEQWQQGKNLDYIEAKELIVEKKATENQHLLNIADEVAEDKIRHKRLIFGNAEKIANKLNTMIDQVDTPSDMKALAETNDKIAITLKVADRHATTKQDININNNTQQNLSIELTEEEAKAKALEMGVPLSALLS